MNILNIKAQLKQNITEDEFLQATFDEIIGCDKGIYDIHKMKNEPLKGGESILSANITIFIPRIDGSNVEFGYVENKNIWDYEVIKE